jgi:hypothetical protein
MTKNKKNTYAHEQNRRFMIDSWFTQITGGKTVDTIAETLPELITYNPLDKFRHIQAKKKTKKLDPFNPK